MSEIRVCLLLHNIALGGLENQVLRIIESTDSTAVSFVVCFVGDDDSMATAFREADVRVVHLDTGSSSPLMQFRPRNMIRLCKFLRDEDIDILHCHGSLYQHVLGRICGRAVGCPVLGTYHNRQDSFNPAIRVLERISRPLSAVDIAVSMGVERSFAGSARKYDVDLNRFDRQTYTIYNGIDVPAFESRVSAADPSSVDVRPSGGEGVVFLNIGRYSPAKNQSTLLEAMAIVVEDLPDAHLFLVGWGDMEEALRESARRLGLEENVTVTGRVPTVEEYYALADVFVLPSLTEGLSVVLLEAMAAELPIIGSRIPGTTEAIIDGETGFLVPATSKQELANAMVRINEEGLRSQFGKAGHALVTEKFDIEDTAASYIDVYRRLGS